MSGLNHFDGSGNAVMADVSEKAVTKRVAIAGGAIRMNEAAFGAAVGGTAKKGDVLGVARIAAIMAVKRTSELIPLCHTLFIEKASVEFHLDAEKREIRAVCKVQTEGKTGVEMEALTGVSVALLTIYDMCKALDRGMSIHSVRLLEKRGGKSGEYIAAAEGANDG